MGSGASKPHVDLVTFAPSQESVTSPPVVQSVGGSTAAPSAIPPWASRACFLSAGAADDDWYNHAVETLTTRSPAEFRPLSIARVEFKDPSVNDGAVLRGLFVGVK